MALLMSIRRFWCVPPLSAQTTRSSAHLSAGALVWSVFLAIMAICLPATTRAESELRWAPGETTLEQHLAAYLTDSKIITDLVLLLDANFNLERPIGITVGGKIDERGQPSYSAEEQRIRLSYQYIEQAVRAQAELVEGTTPDDSLQPGAAIDRAMDLVEYTLYHLVGHALINDEDSGADDLAEAVSSWLMISGFPNGAAQWINDVRAFSAASRQLDGPADDYWHAHSVYRIRQDIMLCWALGADPDTVEPMLPAVANPLERRAQCARSWQKLDQQMRDLLDPVMKSDAPLRESLG